MSFSAGLEALLLLGTFSCFCVWAFRYIYNHDIIVNAHRRRTPEAAFNKMSASLGHRFLQLDTDEAEDPSGDPDNLSLYGHGHSEPEVGHMQLAVGLIFSLGVALLLQLILVLMIQLFGSVEIGVTFIKVVVKLLVVLASSVNPLLVIFLAFNEQISPEKRGPARVSRLVVSTLVCILWYVFLGRFGGIALSLEGNAYRPLLERKTNEIALLGITITAILSGIGSALTPVRSFWSRDGELAAVMGRALPAGPSESEINQDIQSYNSTQMILRKRRAELRQVQAASASRASSGVEGDDSGGALKALRGNGRRLFRSVQSLASLGGSEPEELQREIVSLGSLKEAIYGELCGKLERLAVAKNGSSYRHFGSLIKIGNVVFSIYCIYRLVNVLVLRIPYHYWNTEKPYTSEDDSLNNITKDALAITVAKLIQGCFGYLPLSETQLINQVSFLLSGLLFLCSFQNVLVTFTSIGRFLPASKMADSTKSWLKNLILSELLAIYVIATALLMRSNLPSESAELLLQILSLTPESSTVRELMSEVQFIDAWFDKVFALSGVLSFLIIAMKMYIDSDTAYGYDEEAMMENKLS